MTETARDREEANQAKKEAYDKKVKDQVQAHRDEYDILTQEEAANMNNPLLEINPLSPADSLHWSRNW